MVDHVVIVTQPPHLSAQERGDDHPHHQMPTTAFAADVTRTFAAPGSVYPPAHKLLKTPSQTLRGHSRSSHGVCGLHIRDMFLCCGGCPGLPGFSPVSLSPELLILTLLPLPFAWHLPIDKRGYSILYKSSEEGSTPVPTRGNFDSLADSLMC
jgi:hypothetical protein